MPAKVFLDSNVLIYVYTSGKELSRNNFPKSGGLGRSGAVPFWQEIIELDGHVLLERLGILTPVGVNADDGFACLQVGLLELGNLFKRGIAVGE